MKNKSLQEQLLNSGLASSAKAKSVRSEKRKQHKQQRHAGRETIDDAKHLAQQAQQQKAEKDRKLNQLHKEEAERKQIAAQIRQLIELNRLEQDEEGVKYNFIDTNKVKTLYLSENIREQLINGSLAIVKSEQRYDVVPLAVARKIEQRDKTCIMVLIEPDESAHAEDPYAEFQIPDDLIW